MEERFNGQINISRDLRQNKQTVLGKYDLTDIIFLCLGVGIAISVAYLIGFSPLRLVDEFTAIIISLIPMIFIISLGFRKVAGIRYINYIRMRQIDKKTKYRFNRKADKSQVGEKFIVGFEIERKYVNKYINKFLSYENLSLLQVRYVKDIETNKQKVYFMLDLRFKKSESILEDLIKKFTLNNEIKKLSVDDIYKFEKNDRLKFENTKIIKNKTNKLVINKLLTKNEKNEAVAIDGKKDTDIINKKLYKIYMLNLYDIKKYRQFINKIKIYADVICYFKKEDKTKYVNTFLVVEDEIKSGKKQTKLEMIDKLCDEYGVILNKLERDQNVAKSSVSYLLINPFNNYRIYK